jgi:hypothetical protein
MLHAQPLYQVLLTTANAIVPACKSAYLASSWHRALRATDTQHLCYPNVTLRYVPHYTFAGICSARSNTTAVQRIELEERS